MNFFDTNLILLYMSVQKLSIFEPPNFLVVIVAWHHYSSGY